MAQDSLSSTTQSVGNPGYMILQYLDPSGGGNNISVSFIAPMAKFVQPMYSPHQKVNIAINGGIYTFQLATTEMLEMPLVFQDLPFFDVHVGEPGAPTQGVQSLLSFIRFTLNYHQNTCILTTPDGQIETVRYMGGAESFVEADQQNRAPKAQRYVGTVTFWRVV